MASPQTHWTASMVRALPDDGFRHEAIDGEHLVTDGKKPREPATAPVTMDLPEYFRDVTDED